MPASPAIPDELFFDEKGPGSYYLAGFVCDYVRMVRILMDFHVIETIGKLFNGDIPNHSQLSQALKVSLRTQRLSN